MDNLKNMSYLERMKKLKLPSLKFRRIRGDLIQAFKIINKLDNTDSIETTFLPLTILQKPEIQKINYTNHLLIPE